MKKRRKKLIEVALPLKKINEQSAREKSIRHGHPSTLHLWWARRPLAACRAVLFAQLVDDPSSDPAYRRPDGTVDEERAAAKRAELFNLIEELVRWENSNNPDVINRARAEIARSVASRKIELGELKKETIVYGREEGKEHPEGPLPNDGRYTAWQIDCSLAPAEVVNHFLEKYAPPVLDPFAGGGSIPLEAQRLGLRAHASDLNPVPVLINKALIEIPPKFAGLPPVWNAGLRPAQCRQDATAWNAGVPPAQCGQDVRAPCKESTLFRETWQGAHGLAEDVRYYGKWMRDEAEKRIGHLYPKVKITQEMVDDGRPDLKPYLGKELTVIAWLWARTVASPDPSVGGKHVPLVRSFWLSKKKGKEAYVQPVVDREKGTYEFKVRMGKPTDGFDPGKGTVIRTGALCMISGASMSFDYVREEGKSGRMKQRLMAIVCEGIQGRVYLSPIPDQETIADCGLPDDYPTSEIPDKALGFRIQLYGMDHHYKLFTPRQLTALVTFSDLVAEARKKVLEDAKKAWNAGLWPAQCRQDATAWNAGLWPAQCGQDVHAPCNNDPHWHSRGYLPHFNAPEAIQHIVFRLHDSVPAEVIEKWKDELKWNERHGTQASGLHNADRTQRHGTRASRPHSADKMSALHTELQKRIAAYEDAGYGECYLRDPRLASIVQDALFHFDGERYRLLAWCIMPNHVHVLIETLPGYSVKDVVQSWKSFTAKKCNALLGRTGRFWMPEYFDRFVRSEKQYWYLIDYILQNPVKAGLVKEPEEWKWCGTRRHGTQASGLQNASDDAGETPAFHAYADAVATYLGFVLDKMADLGNALNRWEPNAQCPRQLFARQAIPMVWDFAESNPFSESSGSWNVFFRNLEHAFKSPLFEFHRSIEGFSTQSDATHPSTYNSTPIISTDPPYYDNIGYADLSDFFYVWLRRSLREIYPDLLSTMLTPKAEELIASPYRHGGDRKKAAEFFETGLGKAIRRWREHGHPDYPTTIFYAFKQAETDTSGTASTGWETFLSGVIEAGFTITATWPMRTELGNRMVGMGTNALASSVVLACVPRAENASIATRRQFVTALRHEMAEALRLLQSGSIAPVDLAQAAIGPGMAIFSRYAKVVESDGSSMTVRTALTLINQVLDEVLAEQEGDFDADTRWAVAWFEQFGMSDGPYGVAETLSKAKNTSVEGLVEAGVVASRGGRVKLLGREELPDDWDPATDARLTEWEAVQHLIRALDRQGETGAADLLRKLGSDYGERARDLAYRLYAICERKGWSGEALAYNSLVIAWPEISRLCRREEAKVPSQGNLLE